jgi:hypothetical protein
MNQNGILQMKHADGLTLHHQYSFITCISFKARWMRWVGHAAHMEEMRILIGESEGTRPVGRPTHRWVDDIRMDVREIGWEDSDWIHLTQDRYQWLTVVNTVMNLRVP